jgi:hypothetical protein
MHHRFDPGPRESIRYSPHIQTLSDYPLLIGEVLRRGEFRRERRARRILLAHRIKHLFGGQRSDYDD